MGILSLNTGQITSATTKCKSSPITSDKSDRPRMTPSYFDCPKMTNAQNNLDQIHDTIIPKSQMDEFDDYGCQWAMKVYQD